MTEDTVKPELDYELSWDEQQEINQLIDCIYDSVDPYRCAGDDEGDLKLFAESYSQLNDKQKTHLLFETLKTISRHQRCLENLRVSVSYD